jgi:hypothetical protein
VGGGTRVFLSYLEAHGHLARLDVRAVWHAADATVHREILRITWRPAL